MSTTLWQQLSFNIDGKSADAAGELLQCLGAVAVTSRPSGDEDRFDLAAPSMQHWRQTRLSALFDQDTEPGSIVPQVCGIFPISPESIEIERFEDQDWERAWLEHFKPLKVTENLWVCPSWHTPPEPTVTNVILDPGLAFGTGTHATTALCLQQLAQMQLENMTVFDFGCGSGILAIAALKLGAQTAFATDIDPRALDATLQNARANDVVDRLEIIDPDTTPLRIESGGIVADLVIANILADALIDLKSTLVAALSSDGSLLLSGILKGQQEKVLHSYSEFSFSIHSRDEWIALLSSKS